MSLICMVNIMIITIFSGFLYAGDRPESSTNLMPSQDLRSNKDMESEYRLLMKKEFEARDINALSERLIGGSVALAIGTYGYFFDERGLTGKAVYSATQTAGVLMISNAIFDANRPSLALSMNRYLQQNGEINMEGFRRLFVETEGKGRIAENKQLAYTSAILAGLYGYNGYRAKTDSFGLKNTLYFLSFNFTVISAVSFYRFLAPTEVNLVDAELDQWQFALLPTPTVSYVF